MAPFSGLSAFPITPADPDGRVDVPALRGLVRRLVEAGVDSIGLLGSTGSYPYLAADERARAIEAALAETGGRTPLLVGIGALRTNDAIGYARAARAAGADGGLLAPVSYTPLLDDEVFGLFQAVSGASDLPLCIYNNPGTTHFTFGTALIARLATLPNVVALKNPAPAPDRVGAEHETLRTALPAGFAVGYSTDWHAAEALLAGGRCWYSVAGGLFPHACLAIALAAAAGDADEVRRLDGRLAPLWTLFRAHTSLRVMYAAATHLGLCSTSPPRPILPLASSAAAEVARVVSALELA